MNKADKDKVIAALETIFGEGLSWREIAEAHKEALSIMRGLADAEPVAYSSPEHCERFPFCGCFSGCDDDDTSPQVAQTEAALCEMVRLSEDAGLYDADFQTEAQEREAFDTWFDSTPHGEPSYQETFSAGYQAGRAGSKP